MAQLNLVFKFKTLLNRRFFHSFQYTRALTRSIDASLAQNALRTNPDFIVNYELAIQQHKKLVTTMADLGLQITNLPSDGFADSVFIEDTAIVVDNIALITNPGANSRKKETLRVKEILEFQFKDFHVEIQKEGQMDGGDVLFTGYEIIVGMTSRTSLEGIKNLKNVFPSYDIIIILKVFENFRQNNKFQIPLHLKSMCSMGGENHILIGGPFGDALRHEIENPDIIFHSNSSNSSKRPKYKFTKFVIAEAANALYINNSLIRRSDEEFPSCKNTWDMIGGSQFQINGSELAKLDGALTCCSILIP